MAQFAYEYAPLQLRQIRLIKVARRNGGISCAFHTVNLDALPVAYIAISYCWGDGDRVANIRIEDARILKVTAAVEEVLEWLASRDDVDYFWLDFLSINQEDLAEKGQQVSIMHEVFSRCEKVNAWLGKNIEHGKEAMEMFARVASDMRAYFDEIGTIDCNRFGDSLPARRYEMEGMNAWWFLQAPWFKRSWIVQETVLAPGFDDEQGLVLYCNDNCQVSWFDVAVVCEKQYINLWHQQTPDEHPPMLQGAKYLSSVYVLKYLKGSGQLPTLAGCLLRCSQFHASDPRDKVYASMHLCQQLEHGVISPDYEDSVNNVFKKTAHTMLVANQLFDTLICAGVALDRTIEGLPSWVPDWSVASGPFLIRMSGNPSWNACDSQPAYVDSDSARDRLTFKGVMLDTILHEFPLPISIFGMSLDLAYLAAVIEQWFSDLTNFVDSSPSYRASSGLEKQCTIARIMSARVDQAPLNALKEDSPLESFHVWLDLVKDRTWVDSINPPSDEIIRLMNQFNRNLTCHQTSSVFGTDSYGLLGLAPKGFQEGDALCIIRGLKYPCLLRAHDFEDGKPLSWKFVSICFAETIMYGEGLHKDHPEQYFTVV